MMKHFSWRTLTVSLLILLGVVYALPNLYPQVPALQISAKSATAIPATVVSTVQQSLAEAKIAHQAISHTSASENTAVTQSLWVKFYSTDTQLQARDVLKAKLPANYNVVASLQDTTPAWLQAIGAHPMKLGLDLRGGIHFLLFVDLQAMVKQRLQGDIQSMGTALRQQDIRYSGLSPLQMNGAISGIEVRFRTTTARDAGLAYLHKNYPDYLFKEIKQNVDGQLVLHGALSPQALQNSNRYAMEQNISILTTRVNALGIAEASITQQGADHISVDLPGIQDPARAREMIGKVASLKFQLVDTDHDAATAAATGTIPFGSELYRDQGRPVLLKNEVILKGSNVVGASTGIDQMGRPAVNVRLGSGEVNFHRVTGANIGKPMAVVYVESILQSKMVKGKRVNTLKQVPKIISIATIQSALPGNFQITGLESQRYAQDLALQLRSGAYVAPISIVRNLVVGSTMGKSNIDKGVMSTLIGFVLVVLFMAFYYRVFGLVASFALLLNVVFIIAILSILSATLTLPGIAGIVLTMGMAVDANVLINERIREELRRGMTPLASIQAGYERAFATIVDANVTTLIVAVILFALSSTSVKSFAVNLMVGLITSMITAIFFTRTLVNLIYGGRHVKQLSIGIRIPTKARGK